MWNQCDFVISLPLHDEVDPIEHMTKLLTPLFGDDWSLVLVKTDKPSMSMASAPHPHAYAGR